MKAASVTSLLVLLFGIYYYNQLDAKVTDYCQAGIMTIRQELGVKHAEGLVEAFEKCTNTTAVFKIGAAGKAVKELSCAHGMGIGAEAFSTRSKIQYMLRDSDSIHALLTDCKQRIVQ